MPVSEAFGPWDGAKKLGLFTAEELRAISRGDDVYDATTNATSAAAILEQHDQQQRRSDAARSSGGRSVEVHGEGHLCADAAQLVSVGDWRGQGKVDDAGVVR